MNNQVNYTKTAKRLLSYVFKAYRLQFFVVFISIIISAAAQVSGPMFLGVLIDSIIPSITGESVIDLAPLFQVVIIMASIYTVGILANYLYQRLMATIGQGVLKNIRDDMFEHMQTLPIKYFDTHAHGDIMSRYTNDTDTLRQMINQSIPMVFNSIFLVLFTFTMMVMISPLLSIFAILMVGVMLFVSRKIGAMSGKYFVRQQKDLGQVNGYIEEMMSGQKVIKVFVHEEKVKEDFDVLNDQLCDSATNANAFANMMMPIIANIGNIQYVLTAMIGGYLMYGGIGALTLGSLVSFMQYTRSFIQPFAQISQQFNSIIMALAGADRIFDMMDEESEVDNGLVTLICATKDENGVLQEANSYTGLWAWKHPQIDGTITLVELKGDVRFHNLTFGYNENKTVLHDVNLFAKPGQKLAFVGSTGAGKTTITNLINRFYDINKGSITYDGIDIKLIKKDDLRSSLGIVLQDTSLFSGTIMENIRYGNLYANDEQVYEAAKLANADSFIQMLPNGYQTIIEGIGEDLSQGQRQLLSIARAAIANPPVLILDEATSSIDTRTETIVQNGMDSLMDGRTVFVIAHRLSTIRNSDAIIVLENGQIIERGSHEDLIKEKGKYYQLFTGKLELD